MDREIKCAMGLGRSNHDGDASIPRWQSISIGLNCARYPCEFSPGIYRPRTFDTLSLTASRINAANAALSTVSPS